MSVNDPNANKAGYKETKVGWIPEEWGCAQLSEIALMPGGIKTGPFGSQLHQEDYVDSGVPVIMPLNMKDGRVVSAGIAQVTEEKAQSLVKQRCENGDILFARRGEIGRCALISRDEIGWLNGTGSLRVRLTVAKALSAFVIRAVGVPREVHWLNANAVGQTMLNLNAEIIASLSIPLPPLPEQKKIAEILSTCDEAIEKTGALIEAKKRQKKALMQQLLTGRKRLPGFEGEWADVKIGKLMKEVSRPVDWDDDELYRLVSVRRRSGGLFFREALHGRDIKTKVMHTTEANDFLISKMQVVHGAMAMTTEEFAGGHVSGSYITLVARKGVPIHMPFFDFLCRTKWLYHLTFISSYGVVIEKMTFNLRDFLKKEISIPPTTEEQERICEVLQTFERGEFVLDQKLAALKQQKKALMQKLLTGQVRVKV
ncbi:MAG: restriction endonuclease subunit S [Verrucomicrobiales bacterium]|nr:restriction endonuclease subunit S [Verrucomicrobiales bacterium]